MNPQDPIMQILSAQQDDILAALQGRPTTQQQMEGEAQKQKYAGRIQALKERKLALEEARVTELEKMQREPSSLTDKIKAKLNGQ